MTQPNADYYRLPQALARVCVLTDNLTLAVAYGDRTYVAKGPASDIVRILGDALDDARVRRWRGAIAATLTSDPDAREVLDRVRLSARASEQDRLAAPTADLLVLLIGLCEALRYESFLAVQLAAHRDRYGRAARWLAGLSALLLPRSHRARYMAEYASEMAELPRGRQFRYALNALSRTWLLRRTLLLHGRQLAGRKSA